MYLQVLTINFKMIKKRKKRLKKKISYILSFSFNNININSIYYFSCFLDVLTINAT